jgi:Flp pilus assembly protein TadG
LSRRLRDVARLFLADRRGAIAAMTAVLATTLVGFGGLAAETAFWYAQKRQLQTQADAAALSGAYELLQGNSANAASWATSDAVLNGFNNTSPNAIDTSGCTGTACQVTLTLQHSTALASAALPTVTIRAQAKAELKSFDPGNVACLIATGAGAVLDFLAQNSTSSLPNCTLVVTNAPRADSVTIANGSVTADTIWSHGGYNVTGATAPIFTRPPMTFTASSSTYMPRDPYAGNLPTLPTLPTTKCPDNITFPPCSPCLSGYVSNKTATLPAWTALDATKGYYTALSFDNGNGNNHKYDCPGINTVSLSPGIYFIGGVDGPSNGKNNKSGFAIDLPNNTTLSCPTCTCTSSKAGTGVTFIILPDSSGNIGGVSIAGNANVTLCPPNTDTNAAGAVIPKGLLFYQCDASNTFALCHTITSVVTNTNISTGNAQNGVSLTGVAYFPGSAVGFAQPSGSLDLKCFITIASVITIKSLTNSSSATNCVAAGISTGFPGTGIVAQKTYQVVMTQ